MPPTAHLTGLPSTLKQPVRQDLTFRVMAAQANELQHVRVPREGPRNPANLGC